MRIVILQGSPRKSGNTAHVLNWVEQVFRAHMHTVEQIHLIDYKIGPCRECLSCRKDNTNLCAIKDDDADAILQKVAKADLILLATPVFCWGFPSHLKALLDRMFCLVDNYIENPEYKTRLENKPMGLLVTAGGPEEGNAEFVIRAFYAMVRFMKAIPAGHLLYPYFRTTSDLTPQDKQRATEFALKLMAAED
jgi:multimeric flavodoxin WrbA